MKTAPDLSRLYPEKLQQEIAATQELTLLGQSAAAASRDFCLATGVD